MSAHIVHSQDIYLHSTLLSKLAEQKKQNRFNGKTLIFFTDIDGTYISRIKSDPAALKPLNASPITLEFQNMGYERATQALTAYLDDYSIPIVTITGRNVRDVLEAQAGGRYYQDDRLPFFDVICSSLGTEIYVLQNNEYHTYLEDKEYNINTLEDTGFHYNTIFPLIDKLKDTLNERFPTLHLTYQIKDAHASLFKKNGPDSPVIIEEPYKISLYGKADVVSVQTLNNLCASWLTSNGYPHVAVVVYSHEDTVYVDISAYEKNHAVSYIMELTNADYGVVAGDSGNDKLMILNAPTAAIVPGGADDELIDDLKNIPHAQMSEYYVKLPNGIEVYIEPKKALFSQHYGPESLQLALSAYILNLIK